MIQHKNNWKLGALLLTAPLMLPAVAQAEDYFEQNYDAEGIRYRLKQGEKWTGPDGEIYLFRQNGQFESRAAPGSVYLFSKDFGRFSVRAANQNDDTNGEKWMLDLKNTSSVEKPEKKGQKPKVIQRVAVRSLPIKLFSNRPAEDDKYDPYIYITLFGDRFKQHNPYKDKK